MDGADQKPTGFNPWQSFCAETGWPSNLAIKGEPITYEELQALMREPEREPGKPMINGVMPKRSPPPEPT